MRVNCREQIANPAEPVNSQDERRKCAAVDSLAIVKNLVASSGGAVRAESEEGKGTLFSVAFPAGN